MREAYENRKEAVLSEKRNLFNEIKEGFDYMQDNSPVAMPTPFGYVREETLQDLIKRYEDGLEDTGDKTAKRLANTKYVGFVERPDMEKIVSESMKEVYAQHSSDILARQVGGTHYKKGVQPWTIALDWGLDPWSHNVVKYILRFPYKGGIEDLKKIKHYLDYLIENYDEVTEKYYAKED